MSPLQVYSLLNGNVPRLHLTPIQRPQADAYASAIRLDVRIHVVHHDAVCVDTHEFP